MAWKVDWIVKINGQDMSSRMRPFLLNIEVTDKEGMSGDTCSLTFDDRAGQIKLPPVGSLVEVWLNGTLVFKGRSDAPRSSGSRGGGRTLSVTAKGFDPRGKVKEQQNLHKDDATLKDFLTEVASRAGFSLKIDEQFAQIKRDYWSTEGDSFLSLGQALARELHGTFKIRDNVAVLAARGAALLPPVMAKVGAGGNVISWEIEPTMGRGDFRRTKVRWFDRKKARFEEKQVEISTDNGSDAENAIRTLAADEDQAEGIAEGRKSESERDAGGGSVELDLTPSAQAEAPLILSGARRGVDGTYKIVSVTHSASRGGGSVTRCDVKQPGGGAGKDNRGDKKSTSSEGDEEGSLAPDPELG